MPGATIDPLSLSASLFAIMGAASFLVKTIRNIQDAPSELTDIADAADALESTLEDVRSWLSTANHNLTEGLAFHIQRSEHKLLELSCYVRKHGLTSASRLRSSIASVVHQQKLKTFKQQLSEIRSDLALALSAVAYGQTGRIEMEVQQLVLFGDQALAYQRATLKTLAEQTSNLDYLAQKTEELRLAQDQMTHLLKAALIKNNNDFSDGEDPQAASVFRVQHSISMENEARPSTQPTTFAPFNLTRSDQTSSPAFQCSSICRCAGHKKRRVATPHSTREWVGGLSVTFSGIGPLSSACTIASCARKLRASASVDFTLPSWLASNMVSIWLKAAPVQGPELLLRTRRIIETPAYYTAEQGNLVALRGLYSEGRAGIHDVNPLSGRNTLFDSIFRGHLHLVHYLLDSGADMEAADFCGFTPRDLAFQRVHTACSPEMAQQLSTLFMLDEIPGDLEFTTAHRIVMDMLGLDLGDYLSEHPQDVNKADLLGRTPLWWSVRRDDLGKSQTLLRHGADPNIANTAGRSPLHNAAAQGNLALVEALLDHGASVEQKSFEGKTPLQVAGVYGVTSDVLVAERLLAAGAPINERDTYGRTAVSLCCFDSHLNLARLLLARGADVWGLPDVRGWLPWHWAVYDGAARVVELYLDHGGCDLAVAIVDGGTSVLHFMVERCTLEGVVAAMLAKADLRSVDPDARDSQGRTAAEILEERQSADVPFLELSEPVYQQLLRLVELAGTSRDFDLLPSSPASTAHSWHTAGSAVEALEPEDFT